MECKEAESLVQQYIDHKLRPQKLKAFISHVKKCPSCYEELETYFIIHYAIKYLDEDHDSYNMKAMLAEDIRKNEKQIRANDRMKTAAVYIGIMLAIIVFTFVGILLFPDESAAHLFHNIV